MSSVIWKHKLCQEPSQVIELHEGAHVLSVGVQQVGEETNVVIWEEHSTDPRHAAKEKRTILIVGTGYEIEQPENQLKWYIGTFQLGDKVYHVFQFLEALP